MFTWTNLGPLTLNVTLFLIALAQAFIKQLIRSSNHPIIKFVYPHLYQNGTKYLCIKTFRPRSWSWRKKVENMEVSGKVGLNVNVTVPC